MRKASELEQRPRFGADGEFIGMEWRVKAQPNERMFVPANRLLQMGADTLENVNAGLDTTFRFQVIDPLPPDDDERGEWQAVREA